MIIEASATIGGYRQERARREYKDQRTGSPRLVVVTVGGHLGLNNAAPIYSYLEDAIQRHGPLSVRLHKKATCDVAGVVALVMAARLATRSGHPFELTGPVPLLTRIWNITDSGYLLVHWPVGGILTWPDPDSVASRVAGLVNPWPFPSPWVP